VPFVLPQEVADELREDIRHNEIEQDGGSKDHDRGGEPHGDDAGDLFRHPLFVDGLEDPAVDAPRHEQVQRTEDQKQTDDDED